MDDNPYGMSPDSTVMPKPRVGGGKGEPADPGTRIIAHIIDQALPWIVLFGLSFALAIVQEVTGSKDDAYASVAGSAWLLLVGAYIVYQLVLVSRTGQSLGKRFMKIRVVRMDGSRADLATILFLRNFIPNLLSALTCYIFFVIDAVLMFNPDRATLHDKMSGTKVVRVED